MKETCWEDCLINSSARKVSPDTKRAISLRETASERISVIQMVNEKNCNFVFEDYYASLLEILQAKAFTQGYNILNHLCVGFYLKEVLGREDLYLIFDDVRYKRNSLTYYGKRMEFEVAKEAIEHCKKIMKELTGKK